MLERQHKNGWKIRISKELRCKKRVREGVLAGVRGRSGEALMVQNMKLGHAGSDWHRKGSGYGV